MNARILIVTLVCFLGLIFASEAEAKKPAPKNEDALIYQLESFMKTPEGRKKLEALLKEQDEQAQGDEKPQAGAPQTAETRAASKTCNFPKQFPPDLLKLQQIADEKRFQCVEAQRTLDDWPEYAERVRKQAAEAKEKCSKATQLFLEGKLPKEELQKICKKAKEAQQRVLNLPREEKLAELNVRLCEAEAELAELEAQIAALERFCPGVTKKNPPETPKIRELKRILEQKTKEAEKAQKALEDQRQVVADRLIGGEITDDELEKLKQKVDEAAHAAKLAEIERQIAELELMVARAEAIIPPFVPKPKTPLPPKNGTKAPQKTQNQQLSEEEMEELIKALFKYDPGVQPKQGENP